MMPGLSSRLEKKLQTISLLCLFISRYSAAPNYQVSESYFMLTCIKTSTLNLRYVADIRRLKMMCICYTITQVISHE
ncbi:hypothetical protein V8F33_009141 [Rhypophila sp. PSN 637]